ncbi:GlcNAc-PI de-N-acetylase [Cryobacterium sp. MDB1-18-2]|uniref:PIG-L deacetylase family protein n=1 Tax=unclassified Cryobacterium TaxID=2649013 RepID=UPI00106B344F|nr:MULTISPECIES: PIG-L family deacetylase [unclassified Cryobacterium]TFC07654.1 GlcNAc-PI de-N-acetylase [Cryobacterium sp. MDB2-33-2]TFC30745.1 GlcNAc-PI de-N-acetylase [Cryobacterium sp. MDB1-18-2]TFC38088.1 GlcNAc-PI de-N-acetylase [Cryobacterium sp. MDB1-18-1]
MSILDGLPVVLLVHAHPDDETLTTGALAAELVARGTRVSLLTASRGERGEVVAGPLSGLEGTAALARVREDELDRATQVLGIADRFWLGQAPARAEGRPPRRYRDSGMSWIREGLAGPAADADADALYVAPLDEVTADVVALIGHVRPALVISYDHGGGYGHPDHVRMHEAARAACLAGQTPFAEIVLEPAADAEWLDLEARRAVTTAALRCYRSQLTVTGDGLHLVHSGGQHEAITTSIGLRAR